MKFLKGFAAFCIMVPIVICIGIVLGVSKIGEWSLNAVAWSYLTLTGQLK